MNSSIELAAPPREAPGPAPSREAITAVEDVRCREKGCVFPALENGSGLCLSHQRQELEPDHFGSTQPTWFVLHQSSGPDDDASLWAQSRDRHRLAAQSRAFQQGRV